MKKINEKTEKKPETKISNGITELVFIIDKSGSMAGFEGDTVGGFNSMIEKQRVGDGEVLVSTVLFDNESRVLHDRALIGNVPAMTLRDYCAYGCTALLDAVGGAIRHIGNIHKYARPEDVPENTIFVITTDGMENASRKYSHNAVRKMIEERKEKYGWDFIFLAANIDAIDTAGSIGIERERAANYDQSEEGYLKCYSAMDEFVTMRRIAKCSKNVGADWKKKLKK